MIRWFKRLLHCFICLALVLVGLELAARLDDWVHLGVPFWSTPDRQRDLQVAETWGYRGKPYGAFKQWKLNNVGFRGPDISWSTPTGKVRVMCFGASETFGCFEGKDKEYPAQLRHMLSEAGDFEVINAGMPGQSLKSLIPFWDNWASRFEPSIVLLYPSPMFYLNPVLISAPAVTKAGQAAPAPPWRSRAWERAMDCYRSLPVWLRTLRREWLLNRTIAGKDESWFVREVPSDRLAMFREDLSCLARHMRSRGAEPVLMTHAISAVWPTRPQDQAFLQIMRLEFPQVPHQVFIGLEKQANAIVREVACREGLALIDVEASLGGRHELFGDLVHFNDEGAERMARLVADYLASRADLRRPGGLALESASR